MTKTKIATASFDDNGKAKMSYIPFDPSGEGGGFVDLLRTAFAEVAELKQKTAHSAEAEPQAQQQLAVPLDCLGKGKTYKLNIELELPIYCQEVSLTVVKELASYFRGNIIDIAAYGEGLDEDDIMEAIGLALDGDELEQRLSEAQRYR